MTDVSFCSNCGGKVTADLRFCPSCGTSLAAQTCPNCSAPRIPGANFCGQCGTRLEEMTAALAGLAPPDPSSQRATERRLVSVLFADLVGFTALSEDEDPEAVREFLSVYFDRASEIIDRYGGTVEKFIGDAVMAVWGTPTAHEDDAERAVRAALELVSMIGALDQTADPRLGPTQLRAAVTTGEAAVTPSARGQGLVAGDLVNTSSRLQSVAEPGSILVDETTMVAAGRAIAFEAVPELRLKGKAEPFKAWSALRVVAERGGTGRRDVLEPPFVGREEELRLLKDSLHATSREGKPRLITVVGQAGLGKSRLGWELKKYTDGLTEPIWWHEGQSPAYGEGVAYWALGEMVRARCQITDADEQDVMRSKLAATLDAFIVDAGEREWVEPRLGALLGVADAPGGDRDELFAAWRTFFERIAAQGTVALIFEDLHWADDSLLDFIEQLLDWSRTSPILVVGLARPELLDRRSTWGSGPRSAISVNLEPLATAALADLLRGLVPGCPEATIDEVATRAEGVPLYAVETVRMLLDEGRLVQEGERYRLIDASRAVAVPASLQALVAARLDALDPAERSLVQDASVLGKTFTRPALAAVSGKDDEGLDELLKRLMRKQIVDIEQGRASSQRHSYAFVQGLLREVAYSTLSRRDRRGRHLAAARHFESLEDEELASLVANHYYDAYRSVPDGADGEAAADWARVALKAAAERSIALHANRAAVNFVEQALEVTADEEERARLWVMATEPAWASAGFDAGEAYIQRAIDWYLANDHEDEADDAIATMAGYMIHSMHTEGLRELLESRVARLDDRTAGPSAPRLLNELARSYLFSGLVEEAFEPVDRGLRIAETLQLEPVVAELFATKSWAVGLVGRHRESLLLAEGAIRLAERHGLVSTELRARMNLSDLLVGMEPRRGLEVAAAGVRLAERVGNALWAAGLAGNVGFAALVLGEWQTPIDLADELGDRPHVSDFAFGSLLGTAMVASAFLGRPSDYEERLTGALLRGDDDAQAESMQIRSILDAHRAWAGFASGDLEDVDRLAVASAMGTANFGEAALAACQALRAATWMQDRGRMEALVEHLSAHGWSGDVKAISLRQGRAALAALDGSIDEAEAGYRGTIEAWRRLDMKPDVAFAEMEMLRLFGDHLKDGDAIALEARSILTELGAVSLLERLDEVDPATQRMEVAT